MRIEEMEQMYKNAEVVYVVCGENVVKCVMLYGAASGTKLAFDKAGNNQVSYEQAVELLNGNVRVFDVAASTTCIPVAYKENASAMEVTVVTGTGATPTFKQFKSANKKA